jgi:hypothetical protein
VKSYTFAQVLLRLIVITPSDEKKGKMISPLPQNPATRHLSLPAFMEYDGVVQQVKRHKSDRAIFYWPGHPPRRQRVPKIAARGHKKSERIRKYREFQPI